MTMKQMDIERTSGRRLLAGGMLALALLTTGCATGPNPHPQDPFEPFNRGVTRFNDVVDDAVLKPVATAYRNITPQPARTGVTNFFSNLGDVWSFVNNVLQFKGQASAETFMRVNVNTLFGLGGILDVATELGIERHREDFGQTLGYWGMPSGPYLVLPILGPSTVRDTAVLPVDFKGDLLDQVDHIPTRNSAIALRLVNARANLLRVGSVIDEAALDKYSFTRDAYLQLRSAEVKDTGPGSSSDGALQD